MPCPSHPPWLDHSNYTWRRVQVMKLLIMQFSPSPYENRKYVQQLMRVVMKSGWSNGGKPRTQLSGWSSETLGWQVKWPEPSAWRPGCALLRRGRSRLKPLYDATLPRFQLTAQYPASRQPHLRGAPVIGNWKYLFLPQPSDSRFSLAKRSRAVGRSVDRISSPVFLTTEVKHKLEEYSGMRSLPVYTTLIYIKR
jgi:hypothetical protein